MRKWTLSLLVLGLILTACRSAAPSPTEMAEPEIRATALPVLGEAPELRNEVWVNTDAPIHLADLRGKVVLLDMWTFG